MISCPSDTHTVCCTGTACYSPGNLQVVEETKEEAPRQVWLQQLPCLEGGWEAGARKAAGILSWGMCRQCYCGTLVLPPPPLWWNRKM